MMGHVTHHIVTLDYCGVDEIKSRLKFVDKVKHVLVSGVYIHTDEETSCHV